MITRIVSAVIAFPLLLFALITGGWVLQTLAFLFTIIALYEFYKSFESKGIFAFKKLALISLIILYFPLFVGEKVNLYIPILVLFVMSMVYYVHNREENSIYSAFVTIIGFIYIAISLIHIPMLEIMDSSWVDGKVVICYPFIISFSTDTFAYFSGMLFGKKKLIPDVSPKKTWEGAIGGVIGAVLVSMIANMIFVHFNKHYEAYDVIVVIALIGSVLSQYGDLIASKIKRFAGIKDYGNIMPGHGGVLDRFDGILITAPFVYYAFLFIVEFLKMVWIT